MHDWKQQLKAMALDMAIRAVGQGNEAQAYVVAAQAFENYLDGRANLSVVGTCTTIDPKKLDQSR